MVIGTSLTFYRGYEAHQQLLEQLRKETGLPVSTMTEAVVDGLRSVGAKRIAVATAYADEVNNRLADFLRRRLRGAGAEGLRPDRLRRARQEERAGHHRAQRQGHRGGGGADAVLISCGGLLTLGCAEPIEQRHGIPVVTSTQSAFWKAMRLAGDSGHVAGRGRMLAQSQAVPA